MKLASDVEAGADAPALASGDRWWRRAWSHVWWVGPPVVMAIIGVLALLRDHGLWFDELYTAEMATVRLDRLVSAVIRGEGTVSYLRDAPPSYNGPYYAVVQGWLAATGLRPDEVGLRLLSLVSATAGVAVLVRAVARLAGRPTAAVAGVLVATNPLVVEYSVEARGYALALLCVALAVLGLARWLHGAERSLVLFAAASAAAGLFHWFALLVPVAMAAAACYLRGRRGVAVAVAAALATVPAAAVMAVAVVNGVGDSGAEWIRGVGLSVPRLFLESWTSANWLLTVATGAAVACALTWRSPDRRPAKVVAVAWVAVPVAVVTAVELVRPVYVDRYLLPAAVGIAVVSALGVSAAGASSLVVGAPGRLVAASLGAVLVGASLAATASALGRPPKDDVRSALEAVARAHRLGEPVVAAARWDALGVDHYARARHPGVVDDLVLPPAAPRPASTVWVVRRAAGGVKGDEQRLDQLDALLSARGMTVADEARFDGRYADVVVQRWTSPGGSA